MCPWLCSHARRPHADFAAGQRAQPGFGLHLQRPAGRHALRNAFFQANLRGGDVPLKQHIARRKPLGKSRETAALKRLQGAHQRADHAR